MHTLSLHPRERWSLSLHKSKQIRIRVRTRHAQAISTSFQAMNLDQNARDGQEEEDWCSGSPAPWWHAPGARWPRERGRFGRDRREAAYHSRLIQRLRLRFGHLLALLARIRRWRQKLWRRGDDCSGRRTKTSQERAEPEALRRCGRSLHSLVGDGAHGAAAGQDSVL
jgi:hypothetical protein